ncbi:unnamed protein product [Prorocentrum cordatum]|uniref:Uncharacterized protein n=1 Tax=Prorocentrum cordatum TaxID=2364126 RepID=A0ABN9WBK2_9DINO|nr:unnamed protein product [Polarella glacialis]
MLNRGQSTPHLRYPTDSPTQIDARAFPRRHCKGKRGPHHVRQEEPRETKHCSQDSFRGARRRKEPHPASGRRGRRTAPWGKPQMRHRHRYEEDTGEEEEEEEGKGTWGREGYEAGCLQLVSAPPPGAFIDAQAPPAPGGAGKTSYVS